MDDITKKVIASYYPSVTKTQSNRNQYVEYYLILSVMNPRPLEAPEY
jgi:hypothetical protein